MMRVEICVLYGQTIVASGRSAATIAIDRPLNQLRSASELTNSCRTHCGRPDLLKHSRCRYDMYAKVHHCMTTSFLESHEYRGDQSHVRYRGRRFSQGQEQLRVSTYVVDGNERTIAVKRRRQEENRTLDYTEYEDSPAAMNYGLHTQLGENVTSRNTIRQPSLPNNRVLAYPPAHHRRDGRFHSPPGKDDQRRKERMTVQNDCTHGEQRIQKGRVGNEPRRPNPAAIPPSTLRTTHCRSSLSSSSACHAERSTGC